MKYICLGFHDEKTWEALTDTERKSLLDETFTYQDELRHSGNYLDGKALQAARAAATLRFEKGKITVSDGPFAETKEQLGGIMLLEADDLNHAIQLMSQLPCMRVGGSLEIRPINEELEVAPRTQRSNKETPMNDAPRIVKTIARLTAAIKITCPRSEIRNVMGPGYDELMSTLRTQGITSAGPWFTHHFKMPGETFDFEIGVPVPQPVSPAGRVNTSQLPAVTAAQTIYAGPYEGLPAAWGEFEKWIRAQGRTPAPWLWETYVTNPKSDPEGPTWRTELTRPLAD
jgi:effector-binding domain-containing protein